MALAMVCFGSFGRRGENACHNNGFRPVARKRHCKQNTVLKRQNAHILVFIAVLYTTAPAVAANTTFNFTLRAFDAASNTSSRAFSITVANDPVSTSFTASGTFAVPSGITSVDVLIVAGGGGGGAGGYSNPGGQGNTGTMYNHQNGSGGGGGGGGAAAPAALAPRLQAHVAQRLLRCSRPARAKPGT